MTKENYLLIEKYMLSCISDSAHDKEHIYRVLYRALDIAAHEEAVDYDVLISACMLHDIGRKEEFENSSLDHAEVGAEKAGNFLISHGFDQSFVKKVSHCILCHRFRNGNIPQTLEEKILFDADKLDVSGPVGIARTLIYQGEMEEPLYRLNKNGGISSGERDEEPSFFKEYKCKLENIYDRFFTRRGAELAAQYRKDAAAFYESLFWQVSSAYEAGKTELEKHLNPPI